MSTNYKLRECFDAHDQDVKSIYVLPEANVFLSASRDLSVRVWMHENEQFKKSNQFSFHTCYISVVYFMKSCVKSHDGVIFSAGYDKVIKGYFLTSNEVQFSLIGHSNSVTCLTSSENDELLSGSMDGTVILWDLNNLSIKQSFAGHKNGIWAVIVLKCLPGHFISASADKDVILWNKLRNECLTTFVGHTDCVRGLAELPRVSQFLSCSNDNSVRLWCLETTNCLRVFSGGHISFIYSVTLISNEKFVTSGEGDKLCVWSIHNAAGPIQSISIPVESIWCVSVLGNGDLITGSNDGRIRVFSENPSLQNGVELGSRNQTNNDMLGDTKAMKLTAVGIEMLSFPSKNDGELMKVMDEGREVLYEWSSKQEVWVKKRVLQSSSSIPHAVEKTHDYVFSIDIKDGVPPLKLHYNRGQDPWIVAKKFLDDNDLSAAFLDQVADFIVQNSDQPTMKLSNPVDYCDPFTGSSRYVVPDAPAATDTLYQKPFPHRVYFRYDQINAAGLSKKVREIHGNDRLSEDIFNLIENIQKLTPDQSLKLCQWVMEKIIPGPDDKLFPFIDIMRMLVRDISSSLMCFSSDDFLLKLVARSIKSKSINNCLTTVKLLVNAFVQVPGETLINRLQKSISEYLKEIIILISDNNINIAISSWCLNMSVSLNGRLEESSRLQILELCFVFLPYFERAKSTDAVHRTLVAIGTLACNNDSFAFRDCLTMNLCEKINKLNKSFGDETVWGKDVTECSQQLGMLGANLDFMNF